MAAVRWFICRIISKPLKNVLEKLFGFANIQLVPVTEAPLSEVDDESLGAGASFSLSMRIMFCFKRARCIRLGSLFFTSSEKPSNCTV